MTVKRLLVGAGILSAGSLVFLVFVGSLRRDHDPDGTGSRFFAAATGNTRTFISAQAAYSTVNGGRYDKPECLANPEHCLPAYRGPRFLDPDLMKARSHYRYEFHPGVAADPFRPDARITSPSSLEAYAIVAVPEEGRFRDELGAVCGDSTGVVCRTLRGRRPRIARGACVTTPGEPSRIWGWLREQPTACYTGRD